MNTALLNLAILALAGTGMATPTNPPYHELTGQGVKMSDGARIKLPPPLLAVDLDAAEQRAALAKMTDAGTRVEDLALKPVVVKVRTVKPSKDDGPAVRAVDLWFVVRGDWKTLTSKEFLESLAKGEEGKNSVVSKSGVLTNDEMAKRKLTGVVKPDYEERYLYTTFSLFDRVQLSATRLAMLNRGSSVILAAARIDPRFDKDADYPNEWRPLLRNERAEITPGKAHPYNNAGGYAKITRLLDSSDAALIECHLVYEEPYAWFDGANLVGQKARLMVQEKVRTFRRKLSAASAKVEKK